MNEWELLKERMLRLAQNLWWTWHPEIIDVWRNIDPVVWRECRHSPTAFLKRLGRERLAELAEDPSVRISVHRALSELNRYLLCSETWGCRNCGPLSARPVAYFCAEFGLHESIPLYSGGLGILAGDHLKSASDLGIPTVGVSLFYRDGYFHQDISETGEQIEDYESCNPEDLGLSRVMSKDGKPLTVTLPIQGEHVQVGAWRVNLGRVPLYFLDMESAVRKIGIQELGLRLYGGDEAVRLSQEIILGIGGMKLLLALGIRPGIIHLNEGHCAFASLEYARYLMEKHGLPFEEAKKQAKSRIVFTTHTPMPAGHDCFSSDLVGHTLWQYQKALGIDHEQLMELGRVHRDNRSEPFCMTVLALKTASKANGVSYIHGKVSRQMWNNLWPSRSSQEVPIGHITNGIHVLGWLSPVMKKLFHRYFPTGWEYRIGEKMIWAHIFSIPDEELWNTKLYLKTRLLEFLPRVPHRAHPARAVLNPHVLTIGFARRFTEYKRPGLLLDDMDRLLKIISDAKCPVQFIYSGKAHPKDRVGKELVKRVYEFAIDGRSRGKVIYIEDYDINVCRHLVQGVDLWLNTPRQGSEASGTSGMKVALNGGLHLSNLDGWWPEGYDGKNGFAIGGSRNENLAIRDAHDRQAIFEVIENEVIPLYYKQNAEGVPVEWVHRVKQAMSTLGWKFSSDRMVMDYVTHAYIPTAGILTCQMNAPFS